MGEDSEHRIIDNQTLYLRPHSQITQQMGFDNLEEASLSRESNYARLDPSLKVVPFFLGDTAENKHDCVGYNKLAFLASKVQLIVLALKFAALALRTE